MENFEYKSTREKRIKRAFSLASALLAICLACAGCSNDRLYVGAHNTGKGRTDVIEQGRIERESDDWYGRNKNIPEERREPFKFPGLEYKF